MPTLSAYQRDIGRVSQPASLVDRPLVGIAMILAAGVVFSVADAISKELARTLPPIEIAWLRWIGLIVLVLPVLVRSRGAVLRTRARALEGFRAICLIGSSLLFITGLQYLPLASATTINFVSPLFVTLLSIPLLGEKVAARRWAAVLVGLVGVVIVVRPGSGTFGIAALLPIVSAACWAFGIIATRKLGGIDGPWTAMSYGALVGFAILSLFVAADFTMPTLHELALAAAMAALAAAGQMLSLLGYQRGQSSLLAPFSYGQLIWASGLGFVMFGSLPDGWTWVGATIIIGSGVYTAHRERVRAREAAAARKAETARQVAAILETAPVRDGASAREPVAAREPDVVQETAPVRRVASGGRR